MKRSLDPRKVGIAIDCKICGWRKKPVGRSEPIGVTMCDSDCLGYYEDPRPGSLWPSETEVDFGYFVGTDGTQII